MRKLVLNNIIKIRRSLYFELVRAYKNGNLKEILPKLPRLMIKENGTSDKVRLFYEREILKEKIKFALGLRYEKVKTLELYELVDNIDDILEGKSDFIENEKFIEVIESLCAECPGGKYYVTDLCRNCIAHSCVNNCPRNAITIIHNKAQIDYDKCVNCGLCASSCPYHAIIKLEKPCEVACHSNVIRQAEEGYMEVAKEECSACGACYVACPFGAVETPSKILQVVHRLSTNRKMLAIYAPSAVAQFGRKVSLEQFREALRKIGFAEVFEVAVGADMVAEAEALHLLEHGGLMLTSCCPAFVHFVEKKMPEFADRISPVSSPMVMLSKKLKEDYPDYEIVFIGPCIAKKMEAKKVGIPDYVLTFEEIAAIFGAYGVEPMALHGEKLKEATPYGWGFASTGGVGEAVRFYVRKHAGNEKADALKILSANGITECERYLKEIRAGKLQVDVLEGMGCDGGCIAGPGILVNPVVANSTLKKIASQQKVKI